MADIPQEVLDAYWQNMPSPYDQDMEDVEAAKRHIEAVSSAMFLAGKRAGAEEEKRHQDFVTATAYECGHKAGMERAAEIANKIIASGWATPENIAQAIRSENDGHG